jgi:hypothetical protein
VLITHACARARARNKRARRRGLGVCVRAVRAPATLMIPITTTNNDCHTTREEVDCPRLMLGWLTS